MRYMGLRKSWWVISCETGNNLLWEIGLSYDFGIKIKWLKHTIFNQDFFNHLEPLMLIKVKYVFSKSEGHLEFGLYSMHLISAVFSGDGNPYYCYWIGWTSWQYPQYLCSYLPWYEELLQQPPHRTKYLWQVCCNKPKNSFHHKSTQP